MEKLKLAVEKEKGDEKQGKAARDRISAKTGKQRVVTPSSSSCGFTTSSSEEEQPEKIKVTKKGKKARQKAPVKVPSKSQTASKPKGNRPLENPHNLSCHHQPLGRLIARHARCCKFQLARRTRASLQMSPPRCLRHVQRMCRK